MKTKNKIRLIVILVGVPVIFLIIMLLFFNNSISKSLADRVKGKVYLPITTASEHYDSGLGIDISLCDKFELNSKKFEKALEYTKDNQVWHLLSEDTKRITYDSEEYSKSQIKDQINNITSFFDMCHTSLLDIEDLNPDKTYYAIYLYHDNKFIEADEFIYGYNLTAFILDTENNAYYYVDATM